MLRRPKRRVPPPRQVSFEDFQPSTEWVQEPSNYLLLLHLPGFKEEDLTIVTDKSGKVMVKGRKQVDDSRFSGFERFYDAPKDSNLEKITWKLKDGFVAINFPKTAEVEEKEPAQIPEETKIAFEERKEAKPEENAAINEGNEELQAMVEPKMAVEERQETISKEKSNEKPAVEVETAMKEITEEEQKEEKAENAEKERKEEEEIIKEVSASIAGKTIESEKEEIVQNEETEKTEEPEKLRDSHEGLEEKTREKENGKRRRAWNEEDSKYWLDRFRSENFIDCVLRKVKRNRKLIAIALVALSTGFFISQKLRKRG